MEEFHNFGGGGFFNVEEDNNVWVFQQDSNGPLEAEDSEPENLCRSHIVPTKTDSDRKQLSRHVHVPITCQMFENSTPWPDDEFYTPGLFFKEIVVIGRIINVATSAKNMRIMVNDSTSTIEVTVLYKDYDSQPYWSKRIKEGSYYKIYGEAKNFKDKKSILATNASAIYDFNELTNHFLNVFLNKWIREKGVLSPLELKEGKKIAKKPNDESSKDTNENSMNLSESIKDTKPSSCSKSEEQVSMSDLKEDIVFVMKMNSGDSKAINIQEIYSKLNVKTNWDKFEVALSLLAEVEMQIFSTDDNKSFALV